MSTLRQSMRLTLALSVVGACVQLLEAAPALTVDQTAFTNSLQMPFVCFGNDQTRICIWETRNCDYLQFVEQTGTDWHQSSTQTGPLHPAVWVSWDNANAFCSWLTQKERADGVIGTNWSYRLPTDLEWGQALGLARERGKSPVERFFYGGPALPWGEVWPPPVGFANLASSLAIDGWDYTSPVGSFPPNRFGIYDMVGNVAELVEDIYDPRGGTDRTVRGSAYGSKSKNECAASVRMRLKPDSPQPATGFRCVLAKDWALAQVPTSSRE